MRERPPLSVALGFLRTGIHGKELASAVSPVREQRQIERPVDALPYRGKQLCPPWRYKTAEAVRRVLHTDAGRFPQEGNGGVAHCGDGTPRESQWLGGVGLPVSTEVGLGGLGGR